MGSIRLNEHGLLAKALSALALTRRQPSADYEEISYVVETDIAAEALQLGFVIHALKPVPVLLCEQRSIAVLTTTGRRVHLPTLVPHKFP